MDVEVVREIVGGLLSFGFLSGLKIGGFAFVVGYGFSVLLGLFNYITK